MDCFTFFFLLLIAIGSIVAWIKQEKLTRQRKEALKNKYFIEYSRLNNINIQNPTKNNVHHPTDKDYMDAIMTLDAAEHGVFLPNAEEFFDKVGGEEQNLNSFNVEYNSIDNNENNSPEYYDENEEF